MVPEKIDERWEKQNHTKLIPYIFTDQKSTLKKNHLFLNFLNNQTSKSVFYLGGRHLEVEFGEENTFPANSFSIGWYRSWRRRRRRRRRNCRHCQTANSRERKREIKTSFDKVLMVKKWKKLRKMKLGFRKKAIFEVPSLERGWLVWVGYR